MDTVKRRRQPDHVRAALLDAVVQEAVRAGLGSVTVQGVAERAGVSKGALFHHFPNRQALLEAAHAEGLAQFGADIDALMADDPVPAGRFTRAYVRATFAAMQVEDRSWARFSLTAAVEPAFAEQWRQWLGARLDAAPAEGTDPRLRVARLAADGYWFQMLGGGFGAYDTRGLDGLLACVLGFTHDAPAGEAAHG
ncbi:TetR/AcrR family transcriptional regulator [Stenotrophomonas sp.]|uniref:TetR/AcrR family transcriptional regulator n=1 Tax=Stenotrophomonas sp. TaxID=69392 RepID=UPI002FCA8398